MRNTWQPTTLDCQYRWWESNPQSTHQRNDTNTTIYTLTKVFE